MDLLPWGHFNLAALVLHLLFLGLKLRIFVIEMI